VGVTRDWLCVLRDAVKDLEDVQCGDDGCDVGGLANRECFPIFVSPNDAVFGGHRQCLKFVRSLPVPNENCQPGFTRCFVISSSSSFIRIKNMQDT